MRLTIVLNATPSVVHRISVNYCIAVCILCQPTLLSELLLVTQDHAREVLEDCSAQPTLHLIEQTHMTRCMLHATVQLK
jgi:hypothetical protein